MLPSLHRLRTEGLTTDTCLVTVGEQGPGGAPLLAHSLVLAAASPTLAPILASLSDNEEITLILPGLEREEMEEVLEDIYLGRDKARVFLQEWGLWENGEENIRKGNIHQSLRKSWMMLRRMRVIVNMLILKTSVLIEWPQIQQILC